MSSYTIRKRSLPTTLFLAIVLASVPAASWACTVFVYGDGNQVLFGNSEDYSLAEASLWTLPPTDTHHGCVFLGFDRYAQGGVNTAGLCFDATGIATEPVQQSGRTRSTSDRFDFCQAALLECATIDELESFLRTRYLDRLQDGQFLFADATGASLVLTVGASGEPVISRTEGNYRVITNFNVTLPNRRPCWRYDIALSDMEQTASGDRAFSVEAFADTLDAVHIPAGGSETLYSNVFDLVKGVITFYYQHDFDWPVTHSVAELVAEPIRVNLTSLVDG